ncbi:hypothetical protein [Streptomyces sp. NRRL S-1813]|uniref:hypothetical protein n=1 Tax=Streptomyces sp. NRRL S-1813 TaxID=1463888 RepID=UPI0004CB0407|nr:hypothetical protein [Streptomyces sp. NRRL S-1813]
MVAIVERTSAGRGHGADDFPHAVVVRDELEQRARHGRLVANIPRRTLDQGLNAYAGPPHVPGLTQAVRTCQHGEQAAECGNPRQHGHGPCVHVYPISEVTMTTPARRT